MFALLHSYIIEPLSFPFMQRAVLVATLIGCLCAILSCFLILKGWALMGDAISHAVLPGVAAAYLLGVPLLAGAFLSGLVCALAIGMVHRQSRIKEDTAMGVIFSGMFALGLIMIVLIESDVHLLHILFGNVLGISWSEVAQTAALALAAGAIILLKKNDLLLLCFDPVQARVIGLSITRMTFFLQALLAVTIVTALYTAGIILIIAMLVTPGATAYLLCRRFNRILIVAVTLAAIASFAGTLASYHFDISTAPTIILLQSLFFFVALAHHRLNRGGARLSIT